MGTCGRLFLMSMLFCLSGCQNREDSKDKNQEKITIFEGTIDSVKGPEEEVALLKAFPKAFYKVYDVEGVGSFYIDSKNDLIKNDLRSGKAWEKDFITLLQEHIKPGSTAIDIGSHIGTHTLSMSKLVGEDGRVIAFEPQIKLYSELVMNVLLNGCKNITAYRCALGDSFKTIEMNPSLIGNEGATGIGKGGDSAEMIPLDSLNLNHISLIKIDVENFEYEVLLGAEQTIKRNRPVLIIEIMGNTYQPIPNRTELVNRTLKLVEGMGYSLKYIDGSWSDWIAIPNEKA